MMSRYRLRHLILEVSLLLVAVVFITPLLIVVMTALRPTDDRGGPLAPPTNPTWDNFLQAWERGDLGSALIDSFSITLLSSVAIVAISAPASFYLARATDRLSTLVYGLVLAGLLIPLQLATIPLYTTIRDLGLLGTQAGLVLFYTGLFIPFTIFLYASFLRALPTDYEEAAQLDGCSPLGAFVRVVFPLLRPVTGTVLVLNGIGVYNDFFTPLLYLSGSDVQTVPVALAAFIGAYSADWELIFAGLTIVSVPVLIFFFLMQKNIIQGFSGGVKG
jgi:raffinose/stachyose/melibiose transport system permease protein